ncbi:MAG: hypothetical protein KKD74_06010 [Bacteroidetes bacterium]|nr:hypothetical protein [Bacteroidota bacterium]
MKHRIIILFTGLLMGLMAQAQQSGNEGVVSYITSQHVYVKFASTDQIAVGDTLYLKQQDQLVPALLVSSLSSISCVCDPLTSQNLTVGQGIQARAKAPVVPLVVPEEPVVQAETLPQASEVLTGDTAKIDKQGTDLSGRIAVASYTNLSSSPSNSSQRMRYTLALKALHISGSKLSFETYVSFAHRSNEWSEIKQDVFNGLKIYNLALNYRFNDKHSVWVGRKINPKISQLGASDGLQYEIRFNDFTAGVVAGSRPDFNNYSLNTKLLQYGGYLSHEKNLKKGFLQSSIAIMEQKNNGFVDRRFAYLQHTNSLLKNVYFFGSVEFDLYKKQNEVVSNQPRLSNTFVSLRYRATKQLNLSFSYSARQSIIYYETYKSLIDRLLETDATQGYQLQVNYKPWRKISFGARGGYRFRKSDIKPSQNIYAYVNIAQLPAIRANILLSATMLETSYLKGNIYSAGLTRDFMSGKFYGSLTYRNVNYTYFSSESTLGQHMAELSMSCRLQKKLLLSVNVESTFEKKTSYNRLYVNLTQRF